MKLHIRILHLYKVKQEKKEQNILTFVPSESKVRRENAASRGSAQRSLLLAELWFHLFVCFFISPVACATTEGSSLAVLIVLR